MTADAKSVGLKPTRSPTIPAAKAAGGATANPTNRVAELTRPRRCSGVRAWTRLADPTTHSGTVSPRSACERPSTVAACTGVPPANGSRRRLSVSRNSAAIIIGPRPHRAVSGPASAAPRRLSGPIMASEMPSNAGERPSSRVAYTTRTPCTANHSMFASAIAVMERRTIGCSRTQRRPSVTSCHTLLMDSRGRGVSAERMAAMKTADTRKPTASQSIAIGAVRACTRMPPSDGPATCATAFEACNRLFAATSRVRPTSEGTNAARARSVATANAPPRNDTT